jgi:hypothetical protein
MAIQEFTFKTKHIPGKANVVADVMSRYPVEDRQLDSENDLEALFPAWMSNGTTATYEPELQKIIETLNADDSTRAEDYLKMYKKHLLFEGRLYRYVGDRRVVIPPIEERKGILQEVHDGHGHFGVEATWVRLYMHLSNTILCFFGNIVKSAVLLYF